MVIRPAISAGLFHRRMIRKLPTHAGRIAAIAACFAIAGATSSGHAQHGHGDHPPPAQTLKIPAELVPPPRESKPAPDAKVKPPKAPKPAKKTERQHATHPPPPLAQPRLAAPPPPPPHPQHASHTAEPHTDMRGTLGPYAMSREGTGTSWLPDTTPHSGIHAQLGGWHTMWHATLNAVYDKQGGPRGDSKTFVNGMIMGMAQRPVGNATFGLRAMLSPDALMGRTGYPLLLATGESADGRTHLIDRQHPHELFMELAAMFSYRFTDSTSAFVYAGLPGEPTLGPTAFMHRTSSMGMPEAPITHHWLDSTHITFGVVTAGVVLDRFKLEASAFRGREPDKNRFDIEAPKLDSFSARATWNPLKELSMQVSWGRLRSPEGLRPDVNEDRTTASLTYTQPFAGDNVWSTTAAWGRKSRSPGNTLDGYLLETAVLLKNTVTLFMRAERV